MALNQTWKKLENGKMELVEETEVDDPIVEETIEERLDRLESEITELKEVK